MRNLERIIYITALVIALGCCCYGSYVIGKYHGMVVNVVMMKQGEDI